MEKYLQNYNKCPDKFICCAVNDLECDGEFLAKVIKYAFEQSIKDVYLFPEEELYQATILEALDLIPKSELKIHVILVNNDCMRMSYNVYQEAAEYRKDVELISMSNSSMRYGKLAINLCNCKMIQDNFELMEYTSDCSKEIFVYKDSKHICQEYIDYIKLTLPYLNSSQELLVFEAEENYMNVSRMTWKGDSVTKNDVIKLQC